MPFRIANVNFSSNLINLHLETKTGFFKQPTKFCRGWRFVVNSVIFCYLKTLKIRVAPPLPENYANSHFFIKCGTWSRFVICIPVFWTCWFGSSLNRFSIRSIRVLFTLGSVLRWSLHSFRDQGTLYISSRCQSYPGNFSIQEMIYLRPTVSSN